MPLADCSSDTTVEFAHYSITFLVTQDYWLIAPHMQTLNNKLLLYQRPYLAQTTSNKYAIHNMYVHTY